MADQTATYNVTLDEDVSGAASSATDALKQLQAQITAGTKALTEMQRALKNLKGATTPNITEISALEEKINAQRNTLAKAQSSFINLGGVFKGKGPTEYQKKLSELKSKVSQLPGPLGGLVGSLESLRTLFAGGALKAGVLATAAAFTIIVGAALAATAALYSYGVAQAGVRRDELLTLDALAKASKLPGGGKDMQNAIDAVAATVPMARSEVAKLAKSLNDSGLQGQALEDALRGLSLKATVGEASELMKSWAVQTAKLKESFDALFKDLKIDAMLTAWKEFTDLFSQTTSTGRALKVLVSTILQPLIDMSADVAPILKDLFQDMMIAALEFLLFMYDVEDWFEETFGGSMLEGLKKMAKEAPGLTTTIAVAIGVVGVALGMLAADMLALVIPAMWGFVVAGWAMIAPFAPFIVAFLAVGAAIYVLIDQWDDLVLAFKQLFDQDWISVGLDVIKGLILGLTPILLIKHMASLAGDAFAAFKKAIGSSSPSKLFMKVGTTIPEGVAEGVDAGAPEAEQATADMLRDASTPNVGGLPTGAGGTPTAGAVRGGAAITIGEIHIHATSDKPEVMALDFRRELERVLAGFAAELGAEPEPA